MFLHPILSNVTLTKYSGAAKLETEGQNVGIATLTDHHSFQRLCTGHNTCAQLENNLGVITLSGWVRRSDRECDAI